MIERTMTLARRIPPPLITAALGVLIVAGTLLAWGTGMDGSTRGFEYGAGQVALVAGVALIFASALRADEELDETRYLTAVAAAALFALGAALWFWWRTIGSVDPAVDRLLVQWLRLPRVGAGAGWYLTLFSSATTLALVLRRTTARAARDSGRRHRLRWPVHPSPMPSNPADR